MADAETDEERKLRLELMTVQIDKGRVDIEKLRQEMRWEPLKAVASMVVGAAALCGVVLGLANYLSAHPIGH